MASVNKREWTYNGETKSAWVVRYTDHNAKRRMKTFERKKEADAFRLKAETEIEAGTHIPDTDKLSVAEVCQLYHAHNEVRRADGRIGYGHLLRVKSVIDHQILPYLGKRKFADLKWQEVEDWNRWLIAEKLAPATRQLCLKVLKRIEDFARKRGYTKHAAIAEGKREVGSAPAAPIKTFTVDDVSELLRCAALPLWRDMTHRPRPDQRRSRDYPRCQLMLRCVVNLAAFCGLRYGEIMGLTVPSVDFDRRILRVRHSLTAFDELKGPKTPAGRRDVPIPPHLVLLLREWIAGHHIEDARDLLFRTPRGGPFSNTHFHACYWRPLLRLAGLLKKGDSPYHFHALRHFAASWMIENGLALPDVASLLGHSKFDVTLQVYAHPIVGGNRRHDVVDQMAGRLIEHQSGARSGNPSSGEPVNEVLTTRGEMVGSRPNVQLTAVRRSPPPLKRANFGSARPPKTGRRSRPTTADLGA